MFNGHMDTSYSGREPWLAGRGFRPEARVEGEYLFGLGISNMKGALACYVEAVRALQAAGVRLKGDVLIAAVVGEIEKTQFGDEFRGKEYRGYAAGSRYLVTHGGVADMCVLGEPTEQRIVLGHYGSIWMRLSTRGPFMHTAFSGGRSEENSILRMRNVLDAVLEWIPDWQARTTYGGKPGDRQRRLDPRRLPLAREPDARADRASSSTCACRRRCRWPRRGPRSPSGCASLQGRFPDYGLDWEIYVSAPGAEIDEGHELVRAIDESHTEVYGSAPERDTVRWFSDASVLTRYGIETVNYGTSSGLPGADGENLEIKGLVDTAHVYALTAQRVCGVA